MCALVGYRSGHECFLGGSAYAQVSGATLSGTVMDSSDAAIPNAEITITAEATVSLAVSLRVARDFTQRPT